MLLNRGGIQLLDGLGIPLLGTAGPIPPALNPYDWWDPDLNTYSDSGGTTPVTNGGRPIRMDTQTATGHNMTAGNGGPVYNTNQINGHGAIVYNGVPSNYFEALFSLNSDITVIMALATEGLVGAHGVWTTHDDSFAVSLYPSATVYRVDSANGGPLSNPNGTPVGTWQILGCRASKSAAGLINIRVDTSADVGGTGGTGSSNIGGLRLDWSPLFSDQADLNYGRVALYNSYLSDPDYATAMQSFGTYYGLF